MHVVVENEINRCIIRWSDNVSVGRPSLPSQLLRALRNGRPVFVDVSSATAWDDASLAALVRMWHIAQHADVQLFVLHPSPTLSDWFSRAGFDLRNSELALAS